MGSKSCLLVVIVVVVVQMCDGITIDNQLVHTKKECYERVALGERLPSSATTRRVDTPSLSKCETECSEDLDRCNSFSFGISAKGNGTCELSLLEIRNTDLKIEGAVSNPDFDIYAKRKDCGDSEDGIRDPLVTQRPNKDPIFDEPTYYYGSEEESGESYNKPSTSYSKPTSSPASYEYQDSRPSSTPLYNKPGGVYSSSSSYGSSSFSYGSGSSKPDYYDGKDKYYTYGSGAYNSGGDRFYWNGIKNPYTQNGEDLPRNKHRYGGNNGRPYYDYDGRRPYGDGYGDYTPSVYHDRPLYQQNAHPIQHIQPDTYRYDFDGSYQVYGEPIAVAPPPPLRPANKPATYHDYRGNGYDNLDPNFQYYNMKGSHNNNHKRYGESRPDHYYHSRRRPPAYDYYFESYDRPYRPNYSYERPDPFPFRPGGDSYGSESSTYNSKPYTDRPDSGYGGGGNSAKPSYTQRPDVDRPNYGSERPTRRPDYGETERPHTQRPSQSSDRPDPSYDNRPVNDNDNGYGKDKTGANDHRRPTGPPRRDKTACYRRVLAGKRIHDRFVLSIIPCERLEDCQRECSEQRKFDCETFNYRLDPSNRGKGVCELSATPVQMLDLRKDVFEDRDYDLYELDRNSSPDCTLNWPHWQGGSKQPDRRPPWYDRPSYHRPPQNRPPYHGGHQGGFKDRFDDGWSSYEHVDLPYGGSGDRFAWKDDWRSRRPYPPDSSDRRWDRNFVPYEIADGSSRRNHQRRTWGRYGGSYGYGPHNPDHHKSAYEYWGLDDHDRHYPPNNSVLRPVDRGVTHYDDYGSRHRFNYFDLGPRGHSCCGSNESDRDPPRSVYGHGYGYNTHRPWGERQDQDLWAPPKFDAWHDGYDDCSSRSGSGFRMSHAVIRMAFSVPDIYECERLCYVERHLRCRSYSFRYSRSPSDNCFLSDRTYRSLDLYNDVQPDRDFDIYAINADGKHCRHFVDEAPPSSIGHARYPDDRMESECFWRVRSGRRLAKGGVKAALVATDIAHCEAECLRIREFTCRGFSFRYGPPVIGDILENCQLTDWPQLSQSHDSITESAPCELYERGSYGYGCEPNPFILDSPNAIGLVREPKNEELCFLQYDTSAKLLPESVRVGARLPTENACKVQCGKLHKAARARSLAPGPALFNCMSFSYTSDPNLPPNKDNCLMSDIQLRDLQPGLDYAPSKTHWLFAYDTFDPACTRGFLDHGGRPNRLPPRTPGYLPDGPGRPDGPPEEPPHGRPHGPLGPVRLPGGPRRPPVRPIRPPSRPGGYDGPGGHGYDGPGGHGYDGPSGHGYDGPGGHGYDRPGGHGYDDLGVDTWSVFTVSGWPCRRGTRCAPNVIAGFWSCELEGGEVGSWDYCCHPEHRCGHSKGFNYPWCYVGPSRTQWRPCSDRYYPYSHTGIYHDGHQGYLGGDRNDIPSHHGGRPYLPEGDRRYWDDLYKNGPQSYYDEYGNPLPGYVRVPTVEKNNVRYHYNYGPERPSRPHWVPVNAPTRPDDGSGSAFLEPPRPGGFGVGRYWPVSYLHKEAPPNSTYYNSDRERNRNDIPKEDKRRRFDPSDNVDKKYDGIDRKTKNEKGGTQSLSIDSVANGSNKENDEKNITTTTVPPLDDDKLVLVSSSNDDPNDKHGRIVQTNKRTTDDKKEKLDDKLGRFSDESVEVFAVDEPHKSKQSEEDRKANLERLLKEEKQIEEIGKAFRRRDEKARLIDKVGDGRGNSHFQTIFVPVDIETTPDKDSSAESVASRRGRAFDRDNAKDQDFIEPPKVDKNARQPEKIDKVMNRPANGGNEKNHPFLGLNFSASNITRASNSTNYKIISTSSWKRVPNDELPNGNLTKNPSGHSIVNNGQVFYEVLPLPDFEDKRQMGHVERVELKNHGVNVRVSEDRPKPKPFEPAIERGGKSLSLATSETKYRTTFVDTIDMTADDFKDTQFGARTGHVKKVELPRNSTRIVKRGRRNFRSNYDPAEVRRRLLEKQKAMSTEIQS